MMEHRTATQRRRHRHSDWVAGDRAAASATADLIPLVIMAVVGIVLMPAPRIAQQWERAVVLRFEDSSGCAAGIVLVVPFADRVSTWIDQRTITTSFAAEQTLTADTVPVNVDAVLFWMVHDAQKAALEVQDYSQAVSWAAQTALRDIIGRTTLTDLLRGRERIEDELQALIDQRSNPWGVTASSVEMRDVVIPGALQDAMSREPRRPARSRPDHPRRSRNGDRPIIPGSGQGVSRQSDGAPSSGDEHALRGAQGERRADARAEQRGRVDGDGRPARRCRSSPAAADWREGTPPQAE